MQFGFSPFKMKKGEIIATLNNFLIEQYAAGRKVLLIVDEAQNLSLRVLEEIRLLSGVETTKEKVLRIILAGQPELNAKLDAPELVQLTQRVRLRFHLTALSQSETRGYIQHRLEVAGASDRQLFAEETFPQIFRFTGGVPRLINTLCDTAMMAAYTADRGMVTSVDIDSAVGELQWVEFAARTQQQIRAATELALPRMRGSDPALPSLGKLLVATDGRTVQEISLTRAGSSSAARPTTICRSTAGSSAGITARSPPAPTRASSRISTARTASTSNPGGFAGTISMTATW